MEWDTPMTDWEPIDHALKTPILGEGGSKIGFETLDLPVALVRSIDVEYIKKLMEGFR